MAPALRVEDSDTTGTKRITGSLGQGDNLRCKRRRTEEKAPTNMGTISATTEVEKTEKEPTVQVPSFDDIGNKDRAKETNLPKSRKPLTVKQIIKRMSDMQALSDRAKLEKVPEVHTSQANHGLNLDLRAGKMTPDMNPGGDFEPSQRCLFEGQKLSIMSEDNQPGSTRSPYKSESEPAPPIVVVCSDKIDKTKGHKIC